MMRGCLFNVTTKVALLVLFIGISKGFPRWPIKGHNSLLPVILDIPGEDLKLFADTLASLRNILKTHERDIEANDNHVESTDGYLKPNYDNFFKRSPLTLLSETMEPGYNLWENEINKRFENSVNGDDDLTVNRKRDDLKTICEKGNVFGSWLNKLCIKQTR